MLETLVREARLGDQHSVEAWNGIRRPSEAPVRETRIDAAESGASPTNAGSYFAAGAAPVCRLISADRRYVSGPALR